MSMSYFSSIKDDDDKDFRTYLQEAKETDLSEIERTGCVSEGKDFKGNHVIVMIPGLGLNKQERPEVMFRKMLLLFLRKTHELVGTAYSVVYAHTNIDLMNQYPLIYKFYSILPRSYKKNLQKMYVIHPNVGIRMFFEFARVFLSHKFYNKLCLLESILDFQRIIPPTQLYLPLKFLRKEDEEFEYRYCGHMSSLMKSFDPQLGTMAVLDCCVTFLKENNGLTTSGLFRVPGDENELNLAKVRLQYAFSSMARENLSGSGQDGVSSSSGASSSGNTAAATSAASSSSSSSQNRRGISMRLGRSGNAKASSSSSSSAGGAGHASTASSSSAATLSSVGDDGSYIPSSYSRIVLSENNRSIIIGDLNVLYSNMPAPASNINEKTHDSWKTSSNATDLSLSNGTNGPVTPEIPFTVVTISNVHSIAQIFKMAIRDLPEPLVPLDCYNDLVRLTRQFHGNINIHWEIAVGRRLSLLPIEHISTFIHVISFLREVAAHSEQNQMDAHNLAVVFAPTIFRSETSDPMKAVMEVKLTQVILMEIIKRERVLALTLLHWKENFDRSTSSRSQMVPNGVVIGNNPVLNRFYQESIVQRGWSSFEAMYPIEEQDEAHRLAALNASNKASGGSSAAASSTLTMDEVTVEEPATQTEEEIQEMMAIHMKSAMKGRMNLNLRGREVRDEEVEEEERRSSNLVDVVSNDKKDNSAGNEVDEAEETEDDVNLSHRMTEFCRVSENAEDDDDFKDAIEGVDTAKEENVPQPAIVAPSAAPAPPPRPGRALPTIPPNAGEMSSGSGPRKPLPPTPNNN